MFFTCNRPKHSDQKQNCQYQDCKIEFQVNILSNANETHKIAVSTFSSLTNIKFSRNYGISSSKKIGINTVGAFYKLYTTNKQTNKQVPSSSSR